MSLVFGEIHEVSQDEDGEIPTNNYQNSPDLTVSPSKHQEKQKNPTLKCFLCDDCFYNHDELMQHVETSHQTIEESASVRQESASELKERRSSNSETINSKLKCKYCPRIFSTQEQLEMHETDEHVCPLCDETFVLRSQLQRHITAKHLDISLNRSESTTVEEDRIGPPSPKKGKRDENYTKVCI